MEGVEFFINADEVWYNTQKGMFPLREGCDIIQPMLELISNLYPKAYEALARCYEKSAHNVSYFQYLIVRRFCKCNFGNLDNTYKDVDKQYIKMEYVPCPLRGECAFESIVCCPKINTKLSEAEKRVMRLVCEGKSNDDISEELFLSPNTRDYLKNFLYYDISEELFLSPNTVKRHIAAAYNKIGVSSRAEFIIYAERNSIFTNL